MSESIVVTDNVDRHRYDVLVDGKLAGFAQYRAEPGRLVFIHTEIEDEFGGQGVGTTLASHALDDVRARGLKLVPQCPFIAAFIDEHPEYEDLVVGPA